MANKPKTQTKAQERDRRGRVEAMRKAEAAKERRKSQLFYGIVVLVAIALIAAVAVPTYLKKRNDPANKALSSFGVSAAAASCSAPATSKDTNTAALRTHVADGTVEKYKTIPPSYGPHWNPGVVSPKAFYTKANRPPMERLVHTQEHGYTDIWYDATVTGKQLSALKDLAVSARKNKATAGKVIVSAWDPAYGAFPAGKHIAMAHWGSKNSVTQMCGQVSGAAVKTFVEANPASSSPEPGGY